MILKLGDSLNRSLSVFHFYSQAKTSTFLILFVLCVLKIGIELMIRGGAVFLSNFRNAFIILCGLCLIASFGG